MSETVRLVLTIIQVIVSVILVLTVVFQSGKQAGLSGSIDGAVDTFFGKNKARSLDAKLENVRLQYDGTGSDLYPAHLYPDDPVTL